MRERERQSGSKGERWSDREKGNMSPITRVH